MVFFGVTFLLTLILGHYLLVMYVSKTVDYLVTAFNWN